MPRRPQGAHRSPLPWNGPMVRIRTGVLAGTRFMTTIRPRLHLRSIGLLAVVSALWAWDARACASGAELRVRSACCAERCTCCAGEPNLPPAISRSAPVDAVGIAPRQSHQQQRLGPAGARCECRPSAPAAPERRTDTRHSVRRLPSHVQASIARSDAPRASESSLWISCPSIGPPRSPLYLCIEHLLI
jgi:hypothetical protein